MEPRKQAIIDALTRFVAQRPGLEFGNYGDVAAYRSEMRSITKDRHQAETLLASVHWQDSITADDLIKAAESAYSGRLVITETNGGAISIDYCTGQYFPTEYRRAVCAVLASALWYHVREYCMPSGPNRDGERYWLEKPSRGGPAGKDRSDFVLAGDWLRAHFRKEFGRSIQERWFS